MDFPIKLYYSDVESLSLYQNLNNRNNRLFNLTEINIKLIYKSKSKYAKNIPNISIYKNYIW